ncbi:16S rRNA (cytosine(1402)-N(4))-methyltransferase RsmH [Caldilinea sp.]|uniref:16S rRNA (cytosine(1402)-N(4))-methyltransferase RsmH n=1 Tax=Caldilinea sp. TaxID=2293560 RepID=UPI002C09C9EB|nr:16S rRNA (cytosine(1402)-N(4))-methyltransferase RsmH [Caldilinea sp.]
MGDRLPIAADPADAHHTPVLLSQVLNGLAVRPGAWMIDCTTGGGGHTEALLIRSAPDGRVLGIDADPAAIRRVSMRLADPVASRRLVLHHGDFAHLEETASAHAFAPVDGVLLDLGVSSFQLQTSERGFSFSQPGPLDMRFDPAQPLSAADIVNDWEERDLADIIFRYGEEPQSRRIAHYLVKQRPFATTAQLAEAIEQAIGGRRGSRLHPATRTFQALRIVVNQELAQIEGVLPQALNLLKPGGRLAVISFHSLEDRIVKHWMQNEARTYIPDPTRLHGGYDRQPTLRILTKKPIVPNEDEVSRNPRSRSAKLRVAEKLPPNLV